MTCNWRHPMNLSHPVTSNAHIMYTSQLLSIPPLQIAVSADVERESHAHTHTYGRACDAHGNVVVEGRGGGGRAFDTTRCNPRVKLQEARIQLEQVLKGLSWEHAQMQRSSGVWYCMRGRKGKSGWNEVRRIWLACVLEKRREQARKREKERGEETAREKLREHACERLREGTRVCKCVCICTFWRRCVCACLFGEFASVTEGIAAKVLLKHMPICILWNVDSIFRDSALNCCTESCTTKCDRTHWCMITTWAVCIRISFKREFISPSHSPPLLPVLYLGRVFLDRCNESNLWSLLVRNSRCAHQRAKTSFDNASLKLSNVFLDKMHSCDVTLFPVGRERGGYKE